MAGETHNGSSGHARPDPQTSGYDSELARQARQAEDRSGHPQGGELEPTDSRNITGVGGGGTGTPGGADQQEGAPRWSGDAAQPHDVAASQPDATTAAGQQPGIDRREIEAEQQAGSPPARLDDVGVWSGDAQPNPAASIDPAGTSPEAQHMAAAHVPGQHGQAQQGQAQEGQGQSQGGAQQSQSQAAMNQSLGRTSQRLDPERQGFVDQQAASQGGLDQPQQQGEVGSDAQVEAMLGVGKEDLPSGRRG